MNLIAAFICICTFLFSLFSSYGNYVKRLRNGKKLETMVAKKKKDRKFLIILLMLSLASTIIVLGKGFYSKLVIGLILLILLLEVLNDLIESIFSKRKIPLFIVSLEHDPSIRNFEKIVSAYISAKDFTNASIYIDKAMQQYPDIAVLLALKSKVYRCLDEDEKAVPVIKKALEVDPHNQLVRREANSLERIGFEVLPK